MEVILKRSRIVSPTYHENSPLTTDYIPLSVFDKVTFNMHEALIFAYHQPTPPNQILERGLRKVLSVYRECAGRLGNNEEGDHVILLNDKGVRFVEASVDSPLSQIMPLELTASSLRSLHPCVLGVEELVQIQVTRFTCGSTVLGYTHHHVLHDGQSAISFLAAWTSACRGVEKISPLPFNDRTIFTPRNPPEFMFNHRDVEFTSSVLKNNNHYQSDGNVMHHVCFTSDFLAKLKTKASSSSSSSVNKSPYTTFECLVAHLWKAITRARTLHGHETTHVKIAVNGRNRLNPMVPSNYFGNLVLWAFPTAKVEDLLHQPLSYATKLVHDAISKVNNEYFRSFIDFAIIRVKEETLIPTADADSLVLCPNLEVSNLINFPFYDLDFGGGRPFLFMPSYLACEGEISLVPSFMNDGGVDAFIPLHKENLPSFKRFCYSVEKEVYTLNQCHSSL